MTDHRQRIPADDLHALVTDLEHAMAQEHVIGTTRQRVINRLIYGHPHGKFGDQIEREALERMATLTGGGAGSASMRLTARGGNGRNGDGTWQPTDGRGCPYCGAFGQTEHGGDCPNQGSWYDA